ncbi:MAG: PQQ-binding-like beta-propeller repeat protein [Opitutaceae bacterium]
MARDAFLLPGERTRPACRCGRPARTFRSGHGGTPRAACETPALPGNFLFSFLALALAALLSAAPLRADDWPQWRGPTRDGVWRETGLVEKFSAPELKPVWTAAIGPGYSGPTVAGDRVFLMDRVNTPEQERVHCFDRVTGKPLWTHAYPCAYRDVDYRLGPRASITIADGRAFSLGTMGLARAFDAATGRILWARDLAKDYSATVNMWGDSQLVCLSLAATPAA